MYFDRRTQGRKRTTNILRITHEFTDIVYYARYIRCKDSFTRERSMWECFTFTSVYIIYDSIHKNSFELILYGHYHFSNMCLLFKVQKLSIAFLLIMWLKSVVYLFFSMFGTFYCVECLPFRVLEDPQQPHSQAV